MCVVAAGERQQLPMQPSAVNACACVCVLCHCNRSNYIWLYHFGIADVDLITGLGAAPTEWSTMRVTIRCRWWAASHKCAASAKDKPSCSKQAYIHIYEHKHTTSKYIYIYIHTHTFIREIAFSMHQWKIKRPVLVAVEEKCVKSTLVSSSIVWCDKRCSGTHTHIRLFLAACCVYVCVSLHVWLFALEGMGGNYALRWFMTPTNWHDKNMTF